MCENIVVSASATNLARRRKLWEARGFQCSIIGTCLNRAEIRKLASKKVFNLNSGLADHEIHSTLVNRSSNKCDESRALQRILETKYRVIVTRFSKVKTEPELLELWREYLDAGSIAGAFWAVMTHPALSNDTAYDIHGEIHMIGHDSTAQYQKAKRQLAEFRKKGLLVEKQLSTERKNNNQTKKQLDAEIKILTVTAQDQKQQDETIQILKTRIAELEKMVSSLGTEEATQDLKSQNDVLQLENNKLTEQVQQLTSQIDELQQTMNLSQKSTDVLQDKNSQLIDEKRVLQQEIQSLEGFLSLRMETDNSTLFDCDSCDVGAECIGKGLCGKTVLYVGGQYKMIPRYKQLVEQFGATFLHHDGGQETSRHILPKFLSRADAVLCPVDCVSHDACKCVKKMCKRYQKDYVMMRSSGLSSLARSLQEFVE
jgi:Uncharacterized protein conserved in bacteria (DUF2325)